MVNELSRRLAAEFPEFIALSNLLDVAEATWPRYGLGAEALSELDPWIYQLLLIKLGKSSG